MKDPMTFDQLPLDRLPYPLVAALLKYNNEEQPFRKVHRLIDATEVFVKLHTVAIVADVFSGEDIDPEMQGKLAAGLRTPSLGVWWMFARDFAKRYELSDHKPISDGLKWIVSDKGELFDLMERKNNLISFRNSYAHGATPEDRQCKEDIARYAPRLFRAVAASDGLMEIDWIWADEKGKAWLARGKELMPYSPKRELPGNTMQLHRAGRYIDAHPLLLRQEGDRFFFYNDLKKNDTAANFINYESAEHHRDVLLAQQLLERYPIREWSKQAPEDFTARVEELTESFKGRREDIAELVAFCCGPSRRLRMVWGGPGIGKSALLARLVQILQWPEEVRRAELGALMPEGSEEHPVPRKFEVLEYFIRRNESSANTLYFLQNICQRLDRISRSGIPLGRTEEELRRGFRERLSYVSEKLGGRRLVLFIDGLDEGTEVEGLLESLPHEVPESVVVLYAARNVPAVRYRVWDHLDRERKQERSLQGLKPEDIRALLSEVVSKYEIQSAYIEAVAQKSQGNPLYLKMLTNGLAEKGFKLNAIDSLPANMQELYNTTLRHIQGREPRALDLLRLLAEAQSDLTEQMMAQLLGVPLDEIKHSILDQAMELLHENDLTEDVADFQLFHESLREYIREAYPEDCKEVQFRLFNLCLQQWKEKRPSGEKLLDAHGLRYAFSHLPAHARIRFEQLRALEKKGASTKDRIRLFHELLALCDLEPYREESFRELGSAEGIRALCSVLLRELTDVLPENEQPVVGARLIVRFHKEAEHRYAQTLDLLDEGPPSASITRYARAGQTARDKVFLALRGAGAGKAAFQLDNSLRKELIGWLEEANDELLRTWAESRLNQKIVEA